MRLKYYFLVLLSVFACKKEIIITPDPPLLVGPQNNNSCTTATVISNSQSQVDFSWQSALNADEYELVIRDTESDFETTQTTFRLYSSIVLERAKQYSWWVISKSTVYETSSESSIWTFYLEGSQQASHFPFSADLVSPQANQQISLNDGKFVLSWEATDLDNGIMEYDLYLGTDPEELVLKAEKLTTNSYEIALNTDQYYYWKVLTRDREGNVSSSAVGLFKTSI